MPILQIEHSVRDYDAWRRAFDEDPIGREQGGVRRYRILRPTDEPNFVAVELEFEELGKAEAFRAALLELWSRAGGGLGLADAKARIVEEVEAIEL
jgi:hypothetical protein